MIASSAESIGPGGATAPGQLFVINLAASTSPMALSNPTSPALKRFTFFVSRQREDGRERFRLQRVAAYALVTRRHGGDVELLLTRLSSRAAHPGRWTLPGGGVDHGEHPSLALAREVEEECGLRCTVDGLVGVHDTHFSGTAPSGRIEDYHGVHLVFRAAVADGEPRVVEDGGTTDAVAWVPVREIDAGAIDVLDLVRWVRGRAVDTEEEHA